MKLKILTYNVNKGRSWKFLDDTSEQIKKLIIESNADIVFLQEVLGANVSRGVKSPQFEELADQIWTDYAYGKNAIYNYGHHGNAILSKYPILKWEQEDISTNRFEQRGLLFASIQIEKNKSPLYVYCIHLDLLFRGRKIQINKVIERIKREANDHNYVIAGDFNDWNYQTGEILEQKLEVKDAGQILHGSYLPTFPSLYPKLKLDRIYVSGLKVLSAKTLNLASYQGLSDHLPIICEVEIGGT